MKSKTASILFFLSLILFFSCAKENIKPVPFEDNIKGRTIRYTVQVIEADKYSKALNNDTCFVSLVMNDSIYKVSTDSSGFAVFNNLASGIISVFVSKSGYTIVKYTADLKTYEDSLSFYDSENIRNASTKLNIYPLSGTSCALVSGKAFADTDLTIPGYEYAPVNTKISAHIAVNLQTSAIIHTGDGRILDISYLNPEIQSITDNEGNFSMLVPASLSGLDICINADDFAVSQIISAGISVRKIFSFGSDTVKVYSGLNKIHDIYFN